MVADMKVDKVADMEVHMAADMEVDKVDKVQNQEYKAWNVLKRTVCIGPKLLDAKCTRLVCLLSFASLFRKPLDHTCFPIWQW